MINMQQRHHLSIWLAITLHFQLYNGDWVRGSNREIHCAWLLSVPCVNIFLYYMIILWSLSLAWKTLKCLSSLLDKVPHINIVYAGVQRSLLWTHSVERHAFREWGSLEWKYRDANRDNCFAQGTVAPALAVLHRMAICSPRVREQQPTWWPIIGKGERLVQKPGSKPSEINLQELD